MDKQYFTLITGAGQGLGKSLAIECGKRGMNLLLIDQKAKELRQLAVFIRTSFRVLVFEFEKDLSKEESCFELQQEIENLGLNVNILINNAGVGGTFSFSEASHDTLLKEIKVNVLATTLLTKLFLGMLLRNRPSYILNISSLSCLFYLPDKCVYGSTKSYIYYFSKSLRKELKPQGINVTVLCPAGMNTNSEIVLINRFSNWFTKAAVMNPEDVAPIAIDGMLNKKESIFPGRINKLYKFFNILLPGVIKSRLTDFLMRNLLKKRELIQSHQHLSQMK